MDFLGDFNSLTGKGGFDPIAMYKAVVDISNALQNPYADSKGFQQNIADDSAKLASLLSQNPYSPPPLEALNPRDASLGAVYSDFKSKEEKKLQDTIAELSSKYSSTDYTDQKSLESNLLLNQVLEEDSKMVKPLVEQLTNPTLDGLLSLGEGVLLFGAMYAISLEYKTRSSHAYTTDKAMLKMNKKDSQALGATPDVWELESEGDKKGIMESISEGIINYSTTEQEDNDKSWKTSMGLMQDNDRPEQVAGDPDLTDIPEIQGQIEAIFQAVEKKITQEIKDRSLTVYTKIATTGNDGGYIDINRSIYFGATDQTAAENQPNQLPSWTDSSVNSDPLDPNNWKDSNGSQPSFPVFGKPYNPQTQAITVNMNNTIEFGPNGPMVDQNQSKPDANGGWVYNPAPKRATMLKGWGVYNEKKGIWEADPLNTFTQKTPFSDFINRTLKANLQFQKGGKQPPGTVKFFIEKLHGVHDDGVTPNGRNAVRSNTSPNGLDNRTVFAAYIDSFSESYSPNWDNYTFIGRGEGFPIYKMTGRTINLTFNIIADYSLDMLAGMAMLYKQLGYTNQYEGQLDAVINTKQDWGLGYVGLPAYDQNSTDKNTGSKEIRSGSHIPGKYSDTTETLWQKITFMAQCCYPFYRKDGKMKEQPIIRLRLADIYDLTGYIENMTVDSNEFENSLDLNPTVLGNIPFAVKITMSMRILHDSEPSSSFYGFYHRREFDDGSITPGDNLGSRKIGGDVAHGLKIKSPLSFNGSQPKTGLTETPSVLENGDIQKLTDGLQNFQSTFANVNNMGVKVNDVERKTALQNAMKAYVKVSDMADQLSSQYGTKLKKPNGMAGDITAFSDTTKISNSNASINPGASQIDKVQQNTQDKKPGTVPKNNQQPNKSASDNQQSTIVKAPRPHTQPKTINDILGSGGNG